MGLIDDLRTVEVGDALAVETESGDTYTVRVVGEVDYETPDEYGTGHLEVPVEFALDEETLPVEGDAAGTGTIVARREDADALGQPKLTAEATDVEEHTGRRFETRETLGRVARIDRVERGVGA